MNPNNYTMEELELIAKNILLSRGGAVYPNPIELRMPLVDKDGIEKELGVTSIVFGGSTGKFGGYYVGLTDGGMYCLTEDLEKKKIWRELLRLYPIPDNDIPMEKGPLLERARLRERNIAFISHYGDITKKDLDMMTGYQKVMQQLREEMKDHPVPLVGDTVEGAYYSGKHPFTKGVIGSAPGWTKQFSICAEPYIPFLFYTKERKAVGMSVSGGPFFGMDAKDLEYVGTDERYFCDWGHNGPCADGSFEFPVKVNKWRIKEGVDY